MPKILEDRQLRLTIYIYTNDHEPAHVHVFVGRKKSRQQPGMKIYLGSFTEAPKLIEAHPSLDNRQIINALKLVAQNQLMLLEKWYEIHRN
jgi:hypothetical protein